MKKKKVKDILIDKTTVLIISGFSLVAALAWNSAIQDLFKMFSKQGDGLIGQFLYAIIVTIILVIVMYSMGKET